MLFCACHRCRTFAGAAVTFAPADSGSGGGAMPTLPHVPDSALAKACDAYLASVSSPVMVRHCKRAYFFATALAEKGRLKPDREVLYVSCLFHDLGLEAQFDGPDDFETNGASAAEAFLKTQAAPQALSSAVAQAIELHTDLASAEDARAEVACLHMGTMMDVFGARLDQIDGKFVQRVVAEYPRTGTKTVIADLLKRQIDAKPASRIGMVARKVDVPARVHAAPFAD
jgi:HD superfamily phosphodiesterase